MSVTITSLTHPTMIAKIRQGLRYAALNQGHKMNGHGNRVYIANRKGHNIIRINWLGNGKFIAWGAESKDVTETVKKALRMANVKPVHTYMMPLDEGFEAWDNTPRVNPAVKVGSAIGLALMLTGCSSSGAMTAFYGVIGALFT